MKCDEESHFIGLPMTAVTTVAVTVKVGPTAMAVVAVATAVMLAGSDFIVSVGCLPRILLGRDVFIHHFLRINGLCLFGPLRVLRNFLV